MRLLAFRIRSFWSILDSGWVQFSPDGITVLVGQNESGKSSILEALHFALSHENPTSDDFRIESGPPEVLLRIEMPPASVSTVFPALSVAAALGVKYYLENARNRIELSCAWAYENINGKRDLDATLKLLDPLLTESVALALAESPAPGNPAATVEEQTYEELVQLSSDDVSRSESDSPLSATIDEMALALFNSMPEGVLFNEESGRLPKQVDIDDQGRPTGDGAKAALNFLQIAEIDLPSLLRGDRRARENTLSRANARVSEDFNKFWSQAIGKAHRLTLKCDLDHYSAANGNKAGKPHLVFWICDGNTQLYPKQRSQGVRWFLSFYLQLKSSEKARKRRVFLLDEPGANLHSKAQGDVLKLINQLGVDTSTVVYSTHSPQMLEYPKLFRVRAVQRSGELDDSPSVVIDAHQLGTASSDTLSPVLIAMGADLSQHQVIRKSNNVILEEMSAYYYLSAFWRLMDVTTEAHFIAATGVNKIGALANMFRGWGLNFIAAFDDDRQGRDAYKSMKRELFGDDEQLASKCLLRLPDCPAIEDVFSKGDFARFIAKVDVSAIRNSNGDYLKSASRSKPVAAFGFALDVEKGVVSLNMLSDESKERIRKVVEEITCRLH